jgi:hypothetical protein
VIIPKNCIQKTPSFKNTIIQMANIDYKNKEPSQIMNLINNYIFQNDLLSIEIYYGFIALNSIFKNIVNRMGKQNDVSMVYLFSKYPDAVSTTEMLCAFKPSKYILDLSKLDKSIFLKISHYIRNEGPEYFLHSDDLDGKNIINDIVEKHENSDYITNTYDFIIKCNGDDEIIPIIQNWTTKEIDGFDSKEYFIGSNKCSDVCYEPFYKKINYKNYNNTILKKNLYLKDCYDEYFCNMEEKSKIDSDKNFENKYIKYKNKYLNLKNKFYM